MKKIGSLSVLEIRIRYEIPNLLHQISRHADSNVIYIYISKKRKLCNITLEVSLINILSKFSNLLSQGFLSVDLNFETSTLSRRKVLQMLKLLMKLL